MAESTPEVTATEAAVSESTAPEAATAESTTETTEEPVVEEAAAPTAEAARDRDLFNFPPKNALAVTGKGLRTNATREFGLLRSGNSAGAHLHHARTVCRRAERSVVALSQVEEVNPEVLVFLNRLSDLLFVAARTANAASSVPEETVKYD